MGVIVVVCFHCGLIIDEYRLGHILSFYLLENLPEYEAGNMTMKEYYPQLVSNMDIQNEKFRWQNYWWGQENK